MIRMQLHQIATILSARLVGKDVRIKGVSTDSRQVQAGQLFVALSGENFEGADYCQKAVASGAVAVLVDRPVEVSVPQIICRDTQKALAALASAWLQQNQAEVIAITGSNGKTTVKNMLYSVLKQYSKVQATVGNFNNEIGLPLTVLQLNPETRYLILEMGAAQAGDIAYLCDIAPPKLALVNNVSAAHLGRFGSLQQIAQTKGEIYQALQADGLAVINADDDFKDSWQTPKSSTRVTYGSRSGVEYRLKEASDGGAYVTMPNGERVTVKIPVAGVHNLMNAAAVVAMADGLGVPGELIEYGLAHFKPESGRLQHHRLKKGGVLIDDSYNANPASMKAALSVLSQLPKPQILICGDMLELGETAQQAHQELGRQARQENIDQIYAVGDWAEAVCAGFGQKHCYAFQDARPLIDDIKAQLDGQESVLIKASRGLRLERVVAALLAETAA
ncbi:MAG: UDP-N-acetylmuramoyl-tripeptide--D-alanyl-D-alanine ligase [Proteobacteria bacterium]|nr:UDP-N-acetylmuramoyl-tripeptide--D-alanyl-D-alanine ligase [Pseudomonadota bacterium]